MTFKRIHDRLYCAEFIPQGDAIADDAVYFGLHPDRTFRVRRAKPSEMTAAECGLDAAFVGVILRTKGLLVEFKPCLFACEGTDVFLRISTEQQAEAVADLVQRCRCQMGAMQ